MGTSIPVKPKKKINKDSLISELRKDIEALEGIINIKDNKIQILEHQLIESQLLDKRDERNMNTPIHTNKHTTKEDDMNHSLDIGTFESMAPITFNAQQSNDKAESELAKNIETKLHKLQNLELEAKESENIWHATKAQFLSLTDEEDLEQSMKDQMSDIRRASRVSADVDIITSILSNHDNRASITSLRSFKCDNRINTILESTLSDDDEPEYSSDSMQQRKQKYDASKSYKVKKIVNGQQNVSDYAMKQLNKRELMYLCQHFAKKKE